MSWVVIPKQAVHLIEKKKITWFWGIDPVKTVDGDYVLPQRVINKLKEFAVENREIILPNLDVSTIDEELEKLEIIENPEFPAYEERSIRFSLIGRLIIFFRKVWSFVVKIFKKL